MGKLPPFEGKDTAVPKRTPETIRIRHAHRESTELRGEGCAEKFQCRCFECSVAEAMISPGEDEYAWLAAVEHRSLQRGLDCIRPRIAEDHFATTRAPPLKSELAEHFAQLDFRFRRMHISHGMKEFSRLVRKCLSHWWRRMAQPRHPEARSKIEETVAVRVPHIDPFGLLPENRPPFAEQRHIARLDPAQTRGQLARAWSGDFRAQLRKHRRTLTLSPS